MNGITLINIILITLTMGVFLYLTRTTFRKANLEQNALEAFAKSLAGDDRVKSWRRGFAVESVGLGFSADVFKEGDLRAGVVDVWRIRIKIEEGPRHWLTSKQKAIAAHADVEGLPIHKVQMLSETSDSDAHRFSDEGLFEALKRLLAKRRCRQIEFSKGHLNVCIERELATVAELKAYIKECQELARAFDAAQPLTQRTLAGASSRSASGVPLGVPSGEPYKETISD